MLTIPLGRLIIVLVLFGKLVCFDQTTNWMRYKLYQCETRNPLRDQLDEAECDKRPNNLEPRSMTRRCTAVYIFIQRCIKLETQQGNKYQCFALGWDAQEPNMKHKSTFMKIFVVIENAWKIFPALIGLRQPKVQIPAMARSVTIMLWPAEVPFVVCSYFRARKVPQGGPTSFLTLGPIKIGNITIIRTSPAIPPSSWYKFPINESRFGLWVTKTKWGYR